MGVRVSSPHDPMLPEDEHVPAPGPGVQPGSTATGSGGASAPVVPWHVVLENIWPTLSHDDRASVVEVCKDCLYIARTRLQAEVRLLASRALSEQLTQRGETLQVGGVGCGPAFQRGGGGTGKRHIRGRGGWPGGGKTSRSYWAAVLMMMACCCCCPLLLRVLAVHVL